MTGTTRRTSKWSLVALLLAAALATTALAQQYGGSGGSRQVAEYTLSERKEGRPTAARLLVDYQNPDDPEAKPPAVRKVVTVLPKRGRFDPSVPGSCTATDAELMAQGAAACPEESAIGGGVVTVDTGFPGPGRIVTADVEFFNNAEDPDGEFIFLNTVRDSGARTVIRADLTRRRTITDAGMLPGTPPDGGAIDTVDVSVAEVSRRIDGERQAYVTTPGRCPPDRTWTTRVRFTYADGVSQVVPTENHCRRRSGG
jgi:hypothetical protein